MKRNPIEWLVLAVSIGAIVLLVGSLVAEGLAERRPADPRIDLRLEQGRAGQHGWMVPASISNAGDEAAEAVVLEATGEVGGTAQTSAVELDFLPSGTTVEVVFAFSSRPSQIEVRLIGYRVP